MNEALTFDKVLRLKQLLEEAEASAPKDRALVFRQVRFPVSKKRRIRNKWSRNFRNYAPTLIAI